MENHAKLRLDGKKRLSMGKLISDDITGFNATTYEDGRIVLEPTIDIPAREVWLYRNKKALAAVQEGLKDVSKGKTKKLKPSLLAADDDE